MLVATWNINGVRARFDTFTSWLKARSPDIVCLQEIKCQDDAFPRDALAELGYHCETHGQKGFNGVALLSKIPPETVERGLPDEETDEQSRFIEGVWRLGEQSLRVASIYLPNGNPIGTDKFVYKLRWMERLEAHARRRLAQEDVLVLAGDYNIIPEPEDARNAAAWTGDALFQPESRAAYRRIVNLGFTDALRTVSDRAETYTFWDYQAGCWQKNNGIRIDHLLLSPEAAGHLRSVGIDKEVRGWEKPSDHVPVLIELGLEAPTAPQTE